MKRVSLLKNSKDNSQFYKKKELPMHPKADLTTNPNPMFEFHPQVKKTARYLPCQHCLLLSKFSILPKIVKLKKQTTIKITFKSFNQWLLNTKKLFEIIRKRFKNFNKEFMSIWKMPLRRNKKLKLFMPN